MGRLLVSAFLIPLFLISVLLYRSWYQKYYYTAISGIISFSGISLYIVYFVFQTAMSFYVLDELELNIIGLCNGVFLIIGILFIIATHEYSLIPEEHSVSANQKILAVISIAYLTALLFPSYVATSVKTYCSNEHRLAATKIIEAVNRYKVSEVKMPESIDLLVPAYLTKIPSPKCFAIYHPFVPVLTNTDFLRSMDYWVMMDLIKLKRLDYYLKKCEWIEDDVYSLDLFLIVPRMELDGKDRYDFSSNSWERIPYRFNECLSYSNPSD
jgi:hypothetical protein